MPEECLIEFHGPDACAFLHAQSTTDLRQIHPLTIRRIAFADPKGRVIALGMAWKLDELTIRCLFPKQQADWILQHLARYRLRSRVEWSECSHIPITFSATPQYFLNPDSSDIHKLQATMSNESSLDSLTIDQARTIFIGKGQNNELVAQSTEDTNSTNQKIWRGISMLLGEARIDDSSRGLFVPQQLNLMHDETACLSKGCYPGQEVITRIAHRGKVKRTLQLFVADSSSEAQNLSLWDQNSVHRLQRLSVGNETWYQVVAPDPIPDELAPFAQFTSLSN